MIKARVIKTDTNLRCDFDGPMHSRLIEKGKTAYQVVEGPAQGIFHGRICAEAALEKVTEERKKLGLTNGGESTSY